MDRKIALQNFCSNKILTMEDLTQLLGRSVRTVRIFLKEQKALSSINKNARFYTLPDIPTFDKNGIWEYRGVFFSKYRNLRDTVLHLILTSGGGLTASEIANLVGIAANSSFMSTFKNARAVRREDTGRGVYVYYANEEDVYDRQKKQRVARRAPQQPLRDSDAITVLVELIKHPNYIPKQLSRRLERQGSKVGVKAIEGFLEFHGIKKKRNTHS